MSRSRFDGEHAIGLVKNDPNLIKLKLYLEKKDNYVNVDIESISDDEPYMVSLEFDGDCKTLIRRLNRFCKRNDYLYDITISDDDISSAVIELFNLEYMMPDCKCTKNNCMMIVRQEKDITNPYMYRCAEHINEFDDMLYNNTLDEDDSEQELMMKFNIKSADLYD
jgi:hypothetical protein